MTGKLLIDGLDAYTTYGVYVTEGGYNDLVAYPDSKNIQKNDWPEENGIEPDLSSLVLDSKTLSIKFALCGSYALMKSLVDSLSNEAYHTFNFVEIGRSFDLRLLSQSDLSITGDLRIFSLSFADDFPLNGYSYLAPTTTLPQSNNYKIDDVNLTAYGVVVLEGSLAEIEKIPDIKRNLLINIDSQSGAVYDSGIVRFESKEVTLKCLMRATSLTQLWRNYNALLYDLIRPDERLLYVSATNLDYPFYYKSSSVKAFFATGKIWLEFDLNLEIIGLGAEPGWVPEPELPQVLSLIVPSAGDQVRITFDMNVTGSTGFSAVGTGGAITLTYSSGSGTNLLIFTANRTIYQGETVTVSYSGGNIQSAENASLSNFSSRAATNNSTQVQAEPEAPEVTSAAISTSGTQLTITFDKSVTGSTGFTSSGTNGSIGLTYVSGSGTNTLTYSTGRTVYSGETVTLNYASGNVQSGGVSLVNFSNHAVTNNSTQVENEPSPLLTGLAAYWKLNEITSIPDSTANGNNGTKYGTSLWIGKISNAVGFNGAGDYISIPHSASLNITSAISLQAWVYPTSTKSWMNVIQKNYTDDTWSTPYTLYRIALQYSSSKLFPTFNLTLGGTFRALSASAQNMALNTWHHIVVTFTGSVMKIYLNGVEVATTSSYSGAITSRTSSVYIGEMGTHNGSEGFAGRIDEAAIWNRALTLAEITELFNNNNGLTHPF